MQHQRPRNMDPSPVEHRMMPWIEALVVLLCTITAISPLRGGIDLSPDSVNFVVAAQNLMEHGHFFVYTNWPSHSILPEVEPFTDFPPGYSLYLIPFLAWFREPYLASAWAHATTILAFFGALSFLFHGLRWHVLLRMAGYLTVTVFTTYPVLYAHYWTEPLFIACTLAVGGCIIRTFRSHDRRPWYWAAAFAFLASTLKIIGVFNLAWFAIPLLRTHHGRTQRAVLAVAACTAPVLIWFARNLLTYGTVSHSHLMGAPDLNDTLLRPIVFLLHDLFRISGPLWPSYLVLLVAVTCFVLPLRRMTGPAIARIATVHGMLLLATCVHLGGIWLLSLVTFFSILDDRLLSPSITLGMIAILNGIHLLSLGQRWWVRTILLLMPFLFLGLSRHTTRLSSPFQMRTFHVPPEAAAWEDIQASGMVDRASHFYSDRDFRHQLYARIPQRILWDTTNVGDEQRIRELLRTGDHPFFVMHEASDELKALEAGLAGSSIELERTIHPEAGLVVYTMPPSTHRQQ